MGINIKPSLHPSLLIIDILGLGIRQVVYSVYEKLEG
jgi:hypothetical protein